MKSTKQDLTYPYVGAVEELVFQVLGDDVIEVDSFARYSAERRNEGSYLKTRYRRFKPDKLDRVVVENYEIRRHDGLVVNAYTKPEYGIPIFTLQVGGSGPDKTLVIVDIVSTNSATDQEPVKSLYREYEEKAGFSGTDLEWVKKITSGYALVNQYRSIDPAMMYKAISAYLTTWLELYYKPAKKIANEDTIEEVTGSVLQFKSILHDNDVGLDLYEKNFNEKMLDTIEEVAFGGRPSLPSNNQQDTQNTNGGGGEGGEGHSGGNWTENAINYVNQAPAFARGRIKKNAEEKAKEEGLSVIDLDLIDTLR